LYLWLHRDKGKIETKNSLVVDSTAFTCGGNPVTGSDGASNIVPSSNLCALYTAAPTQFTNGVYKVTKTTNFATDNYDFFYDVSITPASGFTSVIYDIIIFDALTGDTLAFETNTGNGSKQILLDTASNPMAIGESKHITTRIETTAASFEFEATITVGQTVTETVGSPLTDRCFFVSNSANVPVTIDDIRPTEQVPDIKVLDFLKGIFKMFNLTAFLDSSDRVVVKTLDDFYSDSTTTHDISKFIVKDEHTVSEALPFSNIKFEYPEAKTKLAQAFYNLNNVEYGSLNYIADASQGSKYEVLPPFEHMLFERLSDGTTKVNTDVQYGLAVDDDDNSVVTAPLLFYGIYNTSISTPINYVDSTRPVTSVSGITNTTINNYWMPHNANELGSTSTAPAFNLNFGSEINSYTLTDYGGSNNSLFQKFYQTYIQRVFNTKTRIFKYKAVLPLKFLLTYSLADKVFISGRAFTINKITTDLQTGRSTLELLNEPS